MNDACCVSRGQSGRHLYGNIERSRQSQALLREKPAERLAFNKLGGDEVC